MACVFKQVIDGDGLELQRGGSSLTIRHLGGVESFLFFVSRERVRAFLFSSYNFFVC